MKEGGFNMANDLFWRIWEIWDNAYNTYAEGDYCLMWDYLREQVKNGNLTQDDAEEIAEDIVETYDL